MPTAFKKLSSNLARLLCLCCLLAASVLPMRTAAQTTDAPQENFVKAHYTKYEYRIPMRDGKKLFTAVYVPKQSAFADDAGPYPIMMDRTP
jgi:predicted acyl esterase